MNLLELSLDESESSIDKLELPLDEIESLLDYLLN